MPKAVRGKPCVLYLIQVRDSVGLWTKVGIAGDLKLRERFYARDGVAVLRRIRTHHATRYEAAVLEMRIKQWARKNIGRRARPRKKWSGWSESFSDKGSVLPGLFDKIVLDGRSE